jgi:hypothetical protein
MDILGLLKFRGEVRIRMWGRSFWMWPLDKDRVLIKIGDVNGLFECNGYGVGFYLCRTTFLLIYATSHFFMLH